MNWVLIIYNMYMPSMVMEMRLFYFKNEYACIIAKGMTEPRTDTYVTVAKKCVDINKDEE